MSVHILEANGKPAFAVVPIAEYRALLELAEDARDAAALSRFAKRLASGEEEVVPSEVVDRLLAGETPIRVWREFRGLTATELAARIGVTPAHVSKIETGKGEPSVALLRKLAAILRVDMEALVGVDEDPAAG
jgi:DNA-binding XRE family transcriptional regulator